MNKPTKAELIKALKAAISVYQYASMTRYEREVCERDMCFAEGMLMKAGEKM